MLGVVSGFWGKGWGLGFLVIHGNEQQFSQVFPGPDIMPNNPIQRTAPLMEGRSALGSGIR